MLDTNWEDACEVLQFISICNETPPPTTTTTAAAATTIYNNFHEFSSYTPGPIHRAHISKLVSFNVPH
jgi:hypothetical protein